MLLNQKFSEENNKILFTWHIGINIEKTITSDAMKIDNLCSRFKLIV